MTCLGLCDFYGLSLPFYKPIHLLLYVRWLFTVFFSSFLFLLMARAPPCSACAPPLAGAPPTLRTTGLNGFRNVFFVFMLVLCGFENHFTSSPAHSALPGNGKWTWLAVREGVSKLEARLELLLRTPPHPMMIQCGGKIEGIRGGEGEVEGCWKTCPLNGARTPAYFVSYFCVVFRYGCNNDLHYGLDN